MKQRIVIEIDEKLKYAFDRFEGSWATDTVHSNAAAIAKAIKDGFLFRPEMNQLETEDPSYLVRISIGKWLHRNDDYNDWLECSLCGYGSEGEVKYGEGTNFCPHCGADMRAQRQQSWKEKQNDG